jgi:ABC-type uncharacterized transport system YnjBCD ATPase subunit
MLKVAIFMGGVLSRAVASAIAHRAGRGKWIEANRFVTEAERIALMAPSEAAKSGIIAPFQACGKESFSTFCCGNLWVDSRKWRMFFMWITPQKHTLNLKKRLATRFLRVTVKG